MRISVKLSNIEFYIASAVFCKPVVRMFSSESQIRKISTSNLKLMVEENISKVFEGVE